MKFMLQLWDGRDTANNTGQACGILPWLDCRFCGVLVATFPLLPRETIGGWGGDLNRQLVAYPDKSYNSDCRHRLKQDDPVLVDIDIRLGSRPLKPHLGVHVLESTIVAASGLPNTNWPPSIPVPNGIGSNLPCYLFLMKFLEFSGV